MVPMVGLAYFPLLLWLPVLALQSLSALRLGRGMQGAVRSVTKLLFDTPVGGLLKIVWVVMLVLCLDCVRGVLSSRSVVRGNGASADAQVFEAYAAKEGALVLGINLVVMLASLTIHTLNGECMKLEMDRNIMRKQAEQAGEFSKQLMAAEEKKATSGVPKETEMPQAKPAAEAQQSELRKRTD